MINVVNRAICFAFLAPRPHSHAATTVVARLQRRLVRLPDANYRTPPGTKEASWPHGRSSNTTPATGFDVYFPDPHSPCQRLLNENFKALLRSWFLNATDLPDYDHNTITRQINHIPRRSLDSTHHHDALVALTA